MQFHLNLEIASPHHSEMNSTMVWREVTTNMKWERLRKIVMSMLEGSMRKGAENML